MAATRSNTGCWTCRIRKKKCDDQRPTCGPCSFRNITCHGYGERPQFVRAFSELVPLSFLQKCVHALDLPSSISHFQFRVDRSALCVPLANFQQMYSAEDQKAEVEKIQRAVGESLKARRSFRVSKRSGRGLKPQSNTADLPNSQRNITSDLTEAYRTQLSLDNSSPRSEPAGATTTLPIHGLWPSNSSNSQSPRDHETEIRLRDPSHRQLGIIEQESDDIKYPFTFLPIAPPADNAHDLILIMNYLDNIFPLQCYFYQPSASERGRGWLLGLILRSKSAYYTTLAFSTLTRIIFEFNGDVSAAPKLSKELDEYHSLAIAELQRQLKYLPTVSGPDHLRIGVEILACTIQFLSIEVFRETKLFKGWKNDWEFHLDAAGTMLSVIGTGLAQSSTSSSPPVMNEEDLSRFSSNSLSDMAGLDFFMSCYVWSDILRCACVGLKPAVGHSFSYLEYLEDGRIRLDRVMGCRNWAMIAIREITNLEAWKIDMQKRDMLDVPMLYRKGAAIETRLTSGLATIRQEMIELIALERECNLVTEIYALSALVYLAIVLSGNSCRTPAVRVGVARCLSAVKALSPHLIIRIAFPYCIAGCMAADGEKDDFRILLYDADSGGQPLGTLWNCLDIMEEFWSMRDVPEEQQSKRNDGVPWKIVMEQQGSKTLLI